jgi:hypothetical protein
MHVLQFKNQGRDKKETRHLHTVLLLRWRGRITGSGYDFCIDSDGEKGVMEGAEGRHGGGAEM